MAGPWNRWYHCVGATYGTWLHGDRRGFRTRHHRRHVEGDYRNPPPPGAYDALEKRSRAIARAGEIVLTATQRRVVCLALGERLCEDGVEVVELCVDRTHFHVLCRFPVGSVAMSVVPGLRAQNALQDGRDPIPRHLLGRAKKHASHLLRQRGLKAAPGPLWAKRPKIIPIADRQHQLSVVQYIRSHVTKGAALWSQLTQ